MALSTMQARLVVTALQSVGTAGLTNHELAAQTGIPLGKVNANLSHWVTEQRLGRRPAHLPEGFEVGVAYEAHGPRGGRKLVWRLVPLQALPPAR